MHSQWPADLPMEINISYSNVLIHETNNGHISNESRDAGINATRARYLLNAFEKKGVSIVINL